MSRDIHSLPAHIFQLVERQDWNSLGKNLVEIGIPVREIKSIATELVNYVEAQKRAATLAFRFEHSDAAFRVNFLALEDANQLVNIAKEYDTKDHKHLLCCTHQDENSDICNPCHQQLSNLAYSYCSESLDKEKVGYVFSLYVDANPHLSKTGSIGKLVDPDERRAIQLSAIWKSFGKFNFSKAGNAAALPEFARRTYHNELKDTALRETSGISGIPYQQKMKKHLDMVVSTFQNAGIEPTDKDVQVVYSASFESFFDRDYLRHLLFGEDCRYVPGFTSSTYDTHLQKAMSFLRSTEDVSDEESILNAAYRAFNGEKKPTPLKKIRDFKNLSSVPLDSKQDPDGLSWSEIIADPESTEDIAVRRESRQAAKDCLAKSLKNMDMLSHVHQCGFLLMLDIIARLDMDKWPVEGGEPFYRAVSNHISAELAQKHGFVKVNEAKLILQSKEFQAALFQLTVLYI